MKKIMALLVSIFLVSLTLTGIVNSPASATQGYSQDSENPTLVTEVPEGFTALGDPTVTTEDCVTTTKQTYSRTTEGSEESYGPWSEWTETESGLLEEPTVPANTSTHEWRVTGPVEVGNNDATEGVFSEWAWDHFTEWTTDPTTPADPDGQAGDDNPLNLVQIGERYEQEVGNDDAVEAQHYVHAHNEGDDPLGNDEVPPTPAQDPSVWQANAKQEPHKNNPNVTWLTVVGEGLHYTSHGSSGRRDWFYFAPGKAETFHKEYRWSVYTRTFTPGSEETTHDEWGIEERTRTFNPAGEDVTEYVYTSVVTGEPCVDEPEVTKGTDVDVLETSSYDCDDSFSTLVTVTTTTDWTKTGDEPKVFEEPVVTKDTTKVDHAVVACKTPPRNTPNVPTVLPNAGGFNVGLAALGLLGVLGSLAMVLVSRKRKV